MKRQLKLQSKFEVRPEAWLSLARFVMGGMALIAMITVLQPELRQSARGYLVQDYRKIVSTAQADLLGDGSQFTVAKVKTRDNIYLEIFQTLASGAPRLVERIEIPDARDAYFNFNGQASNLAIQDLNGDGRPEILSPSFDRNLVGRLDAFEYQQGLNEFRKVVR
ncbi:MAG TPA: hypothetical protein PLZ57_00565 [Pseudobdellovibrionaceae bacterium]|nr:hypothetical protein [Pseudobdellovibrionaceae bacterium]